MVPHFSMKLHFPHISRLFSAKLLFSIGNSGLWLILLSLISFNAFLRFTKPLAYSDNLIAVFHHPLSWDSHVALARALWTHDQKDQGIQELQLAEEFFPPEDTSNNKQVLGAQTPPIDLLSSWQNEPMRDQKQETYWQTILKNHPDYRDAYIQLAALTYREGNLIQTHANLVKAQILDPNNSTIARLVSFTSKLLE